MPNSIARLIIAITFMEAAMFGQTTVCALFGDLPAADGQAVTVTGDLLISRDRDIAVLAATDCNNRYTRNSYRMPTALLLRPSANAPVEQLTVFREAAVKADELRSRGRTVNASALFTGRLQMGQAGDLPALLTFDSVSELKVEALPDASELPVIPICELFEDLPAWKGRRVAVRGESVRTFEGIWLVDRCTGGFVTNGYRWPVSLSYAKPAHYSSTTETLAKIYEPTSRAKEEAMRRGRNNVAKIVTLVGRIRMRDSYVAFCRPEGRYGTNGFGHLNGSAAELIVEEERDAELTRALPRDEDEREGSCQPPNLAALCASAPSLSQAASLGCLARVTEFLSKDGIDSKDGNASEALSQAIRNGNPAVVKALIGAGAPVNPSRFGAWLPLSEAAWWGRIDVMEILLKAGAKVDGTDRDGATYLASYGYFTVRVLRALLDAGANPNAAGRGGRTALMQASNYGYENAVILLLERGANVHQKDQAGRTALMHAAAGKYVDAIPHLLQKGANVRDQDIQGKTALDIARSSKNHVAVELLSAALER